jgi:hypothetical protein
MNRAMDMSPEQIPGCLSEYRGNWVDGCQTKSAASSRRATAPPRDEIAGAHGENSFPDSGRAIGEGRADFTTTTGLLQPVQL